MNPSERPVSRTPVPLSSIARRAALIRSTESAKSNSGWAGFAGRVLDREPGDAGRRGFGDVGGDAGRLDREAALEVGVHRHVDRCGDASDVGQRLVQRDLVVAPAQRPGEPRAGGGERGEAEPGEDARAAEVPGIGDHEAAGLVQVAEAVDSIGDFGHRCNMVSHREGRRPAPPRPREGFSTGVSIEQSLTTFGMTSLPSYRSESLSRKRVREPADLSRAVPLKAHLGPEVPVQKPPRSHRVDRIAGPVGPDRLQSVPAIHQLQGGIGHEVLVRHLILARQLGQ